jgi:hypothetical protein
MPQQAITTQGFHLNLVNFYFTSLVQNFQWDCVLMVLAEYEFFF